MVEAYGQLIIGLILSVVLVYLVIVVNFQSCLTLSSSSRLCQGRWPDCVEPFLTHTSLSVPP